MCVASSRYSRKGPISRKIWIFFVLNTVVLREYPCKVSGSELVWYESYNAPKSEIEICRCYPMNGGLGSGRMWEESNSRLSACYWRLESSVFPLLFGTSGLLRGAVFQGCAKFGRRGPTKILRKSIRGAVSFIHGFSLGSRRPRIRLNL